MIPRKAPWAKFHLLTVELHFIWSLTNHIFRQQVRPPWLYLRVCMCVSFGFHNTELLYLVGLCPAPARDDHRNPQVWWSLPLLGHPKPSPRSPALFSNMLPEDATMCSIHGTKAIGDALFPARTLLTEVGIMSQC